MKFVAALLLGIVSAAVAIPITIVGGFLYAPIGAPGFWMALIGVSAAIGYPSGWIMGRCCGATSWGVSDVAMIILANSAIYSGRAILAAPPPPEMVDVAMTLAHIFVTAMVLSCAYSRGRRGRLRKRSGCCICGYDLTGNESGVCPECGTAVQIDGAHPPDEFAGGGIVRRGPEQ